MKANSSLKTAQPATNEPRLTLTGFSHRLARPSLSRTVSALNDSLRIDDLWDFSLVERLHGPITRRHY